MAAALLLATASLAEPAEPAPPPHSQAHFYVAGAGLLLLAGGGAFAYYQNREADRSITAYGCDRILM
jgi:hypothetical protein